MPFATDHHSSPFPILGVAHSIRLTRPHAWRQARIKRIMQKDEEVGKVAQATPVVICTSAPLHPLQSPVPRTVSEERIPLCSVFGLRTSCRSSSYAPALSVTTRMTMTMTIHVRRDIYTMSPPDSRLLSESTRALPVDDCGGGEQRDGRARLEARRGLPSVRLCSPPFFVPSHLSNLVLSVSMVHGRIGSTQSRR